MYKIRTFNKIAACGTDLFNRDQYILGDNLDNPDAILVRSASLHDLSFPPTLKAIARAGAGVNNIPVDRCTENGIVVFNTPGANANAVKELAIAALVLSARDIAGGISWVRSLPSGHDIEKAVEAGKNQFAGPELAGKTLGVFGLGAVGSMVAETAAALGMEVYGHDPYLTVDHAWMLSRSVKKASDPKDIFQKCDYIALHIPSTPETRDFINADTLTLMKNGVRIINLARADLVSDAAMAAALEKGKVARYVTDFPNAAIMKMKNVIAIPHLGASTPESEDNCAIMAVQELIDFLENGNINNSVNFPSLINPKGGDESVCVIHRNIPNMLTLISSALSEEGINIENLSSRSKKDAAYSVLEINGRCPESVIERLKGTEGIIRVHIIHNR
ncbi:MAG: 3-phosphoglycerate dehydrogenase family protein [Bacillota bacterium]|nr:3-phosphoglycerate dehydrogenase family protein [Bacillota bacterium]